MAKSNDLKTVHAIISGRVQGVGFRYFAQREASRLGLAGWVRNLAEGNVEVLIQGPAETVEALLKKLREGPALAWVQNVLVSPREPEQSLVTFEIRSTGW